MLPLQEDELDWTRLPELAAHAHMVLWQRTWPTPMEVVLPVLAALREQRIPSVAYHLDRWWGLDREHQVTDDPFFRCDLVVSPDGGSDEKWKAAGVNHLYLPPGVYAAECGEVAPNPRAFPHEVVFVGTHPYPHAEWAPYRTKLLSTLRSHFGRRFGLYPRARGRPVRGKALQQLYATASVVVGDSCLAGGASSYWSDRIPETLGRGGLLIHPEVEGLAAWYESQQFDSPGVVSGGDLLTYPLGDFGRVVELAEWALANPDEALEVAEHGRATVLGRDTYAHRMAAVIDHVEDTIGLGRGPLAQKPATTPEAAPAVLPAPAAPTVLRVRHRRHRGVHAEFELAEGDPDNVAVWEVWQDDTYQVPIDHVRGLRVVDIGANLGAFSVLAAKLGASQVDAYEPLPRLAAIAEVNATRNRVDALVNVHQAAVGAAAGTGWMTDVAAGGAHLAASGGQPGQLEVPIVGIGDVLAAGPVGLLKIDCEGGEFDIIEAVTVDQLATVAHIVMETHGPAMPHLPHLTGGPQWGVMAAKLAEYGRLRTFGHPSRGGLLWADRY